MNGNGNGGNAGDAPRNGGERRFNRPGGGARHAGGGRGPDRGGERHGGPRGERGPRDHQQRHGRHHERGDRPDRGERGERGDRERGEVRGEGRPDETLLDNAPVDNGAGADQVIDPNASERGNRALDRAARQSGDAAGPVLDLSALKEMSTSE